MDKGLLLTSANGLEDLSEKYNFFYWILGGGGALFGLVSGGTFGALAVFGIVGFIIGYAIKASILKSEKYKFRTMDFKLPENSNLQDIATSTFQKLQENGISVIFEKEELSFKHDAIEYAFMPDYENKTFRLRWTFSVGKALLGAREINDYKVLREDTGLIAYTIQNITV